MSKTTALEELKKLSIAVEYFETFLKEKIAAHENTDAQSYVSWLTGQTAELEKELRG